MLHEYAKWGDLRGLSAIGWREPFLEICGPGFQVSHTEQRRADLPLSPAVIFVAITSRQITWSRDERWEPFILPGAMERGAVADCKCAHSKATGPMEGPDICSEKGRKADNAENQRKAERGLWAHKEARHSHRLINPHIRLCFALFRSLRLLAGDLGVVNMARHLL